MAKNKRTIGIIIVLLLLLILCLFFIKQGGFSAASVNPADFSNSVSTTQEGSTTSPVGAPMASSTAASPKQPTKAVAPSNSNSSNVGSNTPSSPSPSSPSQGAGATSAPTATPTTDPNAPNVGWAMQGAVPDPATGAEQMAVSVFLNGANRYDFGNILGICNFKKVAKMTLLSNELDAVFCKVDGSETGKEIGIFDVGGVVTAQIGTFNDGTQGGTPSRSGFQIVHTF